MSAAPAPGAAQTLEELVREALERIQVTHDEIDTARDRRDQLVEVLRREFPRCRVYVNGSVTHGDALNPLTDVDLGVVIPDPDELYGPGRRGPAVLQERASASTSAVRLGWADRV